MTAPTVYHPEADGSRDPWAPPARATADGPTPPLGPPTPPVPPASRDRAPRGRRGLAVAAGLLALTTAFSTGVAVRDLTTGSAPPPATPAASATPIGSPSAGGVDSRAVLAKVGPAVVSVNTRSIGVGQLSQPVAQQGAGSGIVVEADGVVLTNNHVVAGASTVSVTFSDGSKADAKVLGTDPTHDLAVLKVDRSGLPTATLGNSDALHVGDPVVAIGNALALPGGPTVTEGIVSALKRTITEPNSVELSDLIQTDAAINPGNSGGPLLNAAGEVVGINTAAATDAQNVGFSISVTDVQNEVAALKAGESRGLPYLGVQTTEVTPAVSAQFDLGTDSGALVVAVSPGTPSAEADLRPGDVITKAGTTDVASPDDLRTALQGVQPGDTLTMQVRRSGDTTSIDVRVGTRPNTAQG